ncbi:MAG: hypothetical protein IPJ82_23555 [Lewinellaceae bacterium]|nr:hypothetical protein [Lewinellaceae bacterium]
MENKGQVANSDVLYYYESVKGSVYIERGRIRFVANDDTLIARRPLDGGAQQVGSASDKERAIKGTHTFSIYMDFANLNPKLRLGESFSTKFNYILGEDPNGWVSDVRAAKDMTLEDVYPGIDLRLYSTSDGQLEFDWVMDAGADYNKVKMRFEGQDGLIIDDKGNLNVGLRLPDVKFSIPESYQVTTKAKCRPGLRLTSRAKKSFHLRRRLKLTPVFHW